MLLLTSTSHKVTVTTVSGGASIDVAAWWIDHATGTFTADGLLTDAITTAVASDVVPAPPASTQRNVKGLNISNNSANTETVRVTVTDGTNTVELIEVILLAGENLILTETGDWNHHDSNGGDYPSVGAIATQAEMEAGTSTTVVVTPGRLQYHPGVAKAWLVAGVTGNILASYNITSLTDTGTGVLTITIGTDFSSVNYCVQVSVEATATTWAVANTRECHIRNATLAVGTVAVDCVDNTATTSLVKDPTTWHVTMYGDQ